MKCLCAGLRHSSRLLTSYYEKELRPANVTPAQFELLATLAARPGISQSDLATALGVDQTTLSRNLKVLLGRKWMTSASSQRDQRKAAYELSAAGHAALQQALPAWKHAQTQMQRALGGNWQSVWSALEQLSSAIPE